MTLGRLSSLSELQFLPLWNCVWGWYKLNLSCFYKFRCSRNACFFLPFSIALLQKNSFCHDIFFSFLCVRSFLDFTLHGGISEISPYNIGAKPVHKRVRYVPYQRRIMNDCWDRAGASVSHSGQWGSIRKFNGTESSLSIARERGIISFLLFSLMVISKKETGPASWWGRVHK